MPTLADTAMLANLSVTQWTARKFDKKVTSEVHSTHGVDDSAGRYNKSLISRDALAEIERAANAARTRHYFRTSPWLDSGPRILTAAGYLAYAAEMAKYRDEFEAAAAKFVANYPAYVEAAKASLNGLFNPADYPDPAQIAKRFSFGLSIMPVPAGNDFRVIGMSDADADAIRADIEARTRDAMQAAMRDAFERVAEKVGHMAAKLAEYRPATDAEKTTGIFRDSLVENVRDLAEILPTLNVAADPRLDALAAEIRAKLCGHDAKALREDETARMQTAEAAAAIVAQVSDFLA